MRPALILPRTSRKTASAVTFPRRKTTGFTCVAIRFSARSEQEPHGPALEHSRRLVMRKYPLIAIAAVGLLGAGLWARTSTAIAAQSQTSTAVFLPDGKV